MSHFSATVRIPSNKTLEEALKMVEEILAPYNEQDEKYMEFQDCTDEIEKEYKSKILEVVKFENKYCFKFEDEIKDKNLETIQITPNEMYSTLEEFAKDYYDYERNEDNKFGTYNNPKAKWDWYQIGGRWEGNYPVNNEIFLNEKESYKNIREPSRWERSNEISISEDELIKTRTVDAVRIVNIDYDRSFGCTDERVDKFIKEYEQLINGVEFEIFQGPREDAINLGLAKCKNDNDIIVEEKCSKIIKPWKRLTIDYKEKSDIFEPLCKIDRNNLVYYFNSLRTYCYVTEKEFIDPGEMGWFGCSSATPETRFNYMKKFMEWFRSGDQSDWVICCDLHI
jgi:hypothetical protein